MRSIEYLRHHYPALAGLRGLAVLLVFLHHFVGILRDNRVLWWGFVGVDFFFVLSGFLITGILFDALGSPRYFTNFYLRRTLRIFPLFYAIWLAVILLSPWLHPLWNRYIMLWALYAGNLTSQLAGAHRGDFIYYHLIHFKRPIPHLEGIGVGHLWSLCVEEQFYLVWPMLVASIRSRTTLMRVCTCGIVGILALRIAILFIASPYLRDSAFVYYSSYTRFDTLLVGAWIALWLRGTKLPSPETFRTAYRALILGSASVLILGQAAIHFNFATLRFQHAAKQSLASPTISTYGFTLIALIGAGLLMACLSPASHIHRALLFRPLARLGHISYGFYLLHMLPFMFYVDFQRLHIDKRHGLAAFVLNNGLLLFAFASTYFAASLSYRYLEMPFLRLKSRLAPRPYAEPESSSDHDLQGDLALARSA